MTIACVAACARNNVIGKDGKIPWFITGEQQRFKELTTGHTVIMGRRTYDEIAAKLGGPLPNRRTIVISSSMEPASGAYDGRLWVTSSESDALSVASALSTDSDDLVFIAGGQSIYRAFLPLAEILYLTEIDADIDGNVFFPPFDTEQWERNVISEHQAELPYRYVTWTRK